MLSCIHHIIKIYCGITKDKTIYWTAIRHVVIYGSEVLDLEHKLRKHLSSMGKKDTEKNIWPRKTKWCVDDPHQSRVDESV